MIKPVKIRKDPVPITEEGYYGPFTFEDFMSDWLCSYCKQKLENCFTVECKNCGAYYGKLD